MEQQTDELTLALQQMQNNLKRVSEEHTERLWLQTGKNALNEKLRGDKDLPQLSKEIVDFFAFYFDAQIGTIYILEEDTFILQYTRGIKGKADSSFKLGEGLVGQTAMDKKLSVCNKIPETYFKIQSSLGLEKPDTIVILPLVFNHKTIGVVELAKLDNFTPVQLQLTKEISESIAIAVNTAINQQSLKKLLDELELQKNEMGKTALELAQQVDCLNNTAIVSITDEKGDIIYVNDKFCEISKYSREELMGKNHRILKSGKQPDGLFVGMWKMIGLGRVWHGEIVNKAKDGTFYWVDTTITPFKGLNDKTEKYVAIRFDITKTKNQKTEIEVITKSIYESNFAIEFDMNGYVLQANEIFRDVMGYEEKEVVGKHHSLFVEKGYETTKEYSEFWDTLRKGEFKTGEFKRITKNGDIAWIKGNYNPILDTEGRPYKVLKIATDITLTIKQKEELAQQAEELQTQQEELRQLNEELEEQAQSLKQQQEELQITNEELEEQTQALEMKNKEVEEAKYDIEQKTRQLEISSKYKSEFLANMSHELRTPLNSLLILSKDLAENKNKTLDSEQVESAEIIYKSGQDLLVLINEVLDLSKIEAGKMTLTVEKISLRNLLDDLLRDFKLQAEKKGLQTHILFNEQVPDRIRTDSQRLKQILKNLLSNAIKFTDQGSISIQVNIQTPDTLIISVADTGIGIPEDKQLAIFEAFQQADGGTSRKYGGTGLGLSISRELANLLHAEIKLSSKVNEGSVFSLILPLNISEEESRKKEPSLIVSDKAGTNHFINYPGLEDDRNSIDPDDKVVLIIEDDLKFASILFKQANQKGFKGLSAATGEDGLLLTRKYTPDAIILDLHLPGMSGRHVLNELKNSPDLRHIPVHIISGNERSLDPIKEGALEYLVKPLGKKELEEAFNRIENFISRKMKNLLIVEDDANSRKAIQKLIGNGDVKCFEASTGADALSVYSENQIDCIVLDIGLPDMSGFDLIYNLENTENGRTPPIIIYTGKELTKEENEELQKYADSIIIKGVKSEERLLDETALFLHRTISNLPESKQTIIHSVYDKEAIFRSKKILLTDDDMRNVFALSKVLKERGMEIIKADNGKTALEMLNRHSSIDLVLMDIMMPEMDGYEAIKQIRNQRKFANLPVIALTAKAMKDDKQKCIDAGANDYIAKPVDIERLLSLMRVWLSK